MVARTGEQYLEGLRDRRQVWLGDKKVNLFDEPAFAGSLRGMAGYFDWQHKHADACLHHNDVTGDIANGSLLVPRSRAVLEQRARCFEQLARYSYGMLGRTTDYVNTTLSGLVAQVHYMAQGRDPVFAQRVVDFHREVAKRDLSLTHAVVPPTIDRGAGPFDGLNGQIALKVVRRTETGVIVRGAKILATLAPFADEIFVYPSGPIAPNTDPAYALVFSIPMDTPGLITVCRDHYGTNAELRDQPFSARFDEQDAFMIFDDVEIPYERVFVDGDVEAYNNLCKWHWDANVMQQTATRAAVKLEFAYDLCTQMARVCNSEKSPDVSAMLGEVWSYGRMVRNGLKAAMEGARDYGNGAFLLDEWPLKAVRCLVPGWMVRVNEIIRLIGSHNLLATPTYKALKNPAMAPLLKAYMPGAQGLEAETRAEVMRVAWDFVGSALAGRVELYERYYLASSPKNMAITHMQYQFTSPPKLVQEFLAEVGA